MSCFSTSAFRNVRFLFHTSFFFFFSADLRSFPLWYARVLHCCAVLFFCLFQTSCQHQFIWMFSLWLTAALSKKKNECKQKTIFVGVGRKERVSCHPFLRSRRAGGWSAFTGRSALTCPGPAAPLQHKLDFRTGTVDDTHQDLGVVLIKTTLQEAF